MQWSWMLLALLASAAGKGRKQKHYKPAYIALPGHPSGARLIVASAYLPGDSKDHPATQLAPLLEYCREQKAQLVMSCDCNSHHVSWGSTDTNERGRALLDRLSSTTLTDVPLQVPSNSGPSSGLQPAPVDVGPYSTVQANATCGLDGAEEYCRDTPAKRIACDICEGRDGSSSRRHPASHAVDGDHRTWWQSPSMAAGDYQRVELVATLPDKLELLHVIIKSGPSPRPLAWSLDISASVDEDDWLMIKAFGDKEHCRKLWGLRPERRRRKARAVKTRKRDRRLREMDERQRDMHTLMNMYTEISSKGSGVSNVEYRGIKNDDVIMRNISIDVNDSGINSVDRLRHIEEINRKISEMKRRIRNSDQGIVNKDREMIRKNVEIINRDRIRMIQTIREREFRHLQRLREISNPVLRARDYRFRRDAPEITLDREPKQGRKRSDRAEKATCSTQFASPRPLENGEVHIGLGEGVVCRRVRISFQATHPAPDIRRYYTVRALTLAARCLCHGHASHCPITHKGAKCDCVHGTCGTHCRHCCSGGRWSPNLPCDEDEIIPQAIVPIPDVATDDVTNDLTSEEADCQCGDRGACLHDDIGTVICVNCTENRAGPLCDRCLVGYYSAVPDGPCLPCNCHPDGSDGSCTFDHHTRSIICNCNPNYTGSSCDSCLDPDAIFPGCEYPTTPRCKCDPRGIVDPERICDDFCECKEYVVGERCDQCLTGYFGLSEALPRGCVPCYCSHVTDHCVTNPDIDSDMMLPLSGWLVATADGNETMEPAMDDQGNLYLISYEVEGWESLYWVWRGLAGPALGLYGSEVRARMQWGIVRGDTGGSPTTQPDLVIVKQDGTKLFSTTVSHTNPGELELSVPIMEGNWFRPDDDQPVSRADVMDVLADLKQLMVRAHFHGDQDEVRLESVVINPLPIPREICACPVGYTGAHCEACAWNHLRVDSQCVPCACNQHASCYDVDGPCGPCQHNTTGPHCERCLPGHYGNPVQGACKPCACPLYLPSNNFSPNCALASSEGDEYVCTQCPEGYAGDHCETCEFGYWGSPATPGGSCKPCDCGGGGCDTHSGACLTCPPNTEGASCDQCQEGFWFGASSSPVSCIPCACGAGALASACDVRSGACACKDGWTGRKCDRCDLGYGDPGAGCVPCACGVGALDPLCAADSGHCACAPGAAAPHCHACLPAHYSITHHGCQGCNCSAIGSESNACDIRTGQCRCKPHFTGRACDSCEEGYWAPPGQPCRRCECGAGAAACDPLRGTCACARGVQGQHCDACLSGYYGFGPQGCFPCPPCPEGKVCSPETGRCVCPAHSHGPRCQHCAPGYWLRSNGCRRCQCGPGAVSGTCDPLTGKCQCRLGWMGEECDACAPGYFGPRCRPCHCNPPGTTDCGNGTCVCDEQGRCPCKENVVGDKCDQCLDGTFGLSAENPAGCTACFCFGRSAHCTQASVTRAALHAASPTHLTLLMSESVTSMDQESLLAIHTHSLDVTISLPWPPVPVYMELDRRFLGDRVTSYGGALRFRVEEEGGQELSAETRARFPLVRLYGRNIVLDYHERVPPINGTHVVRLHESLWSVRTRSTVKAAASRSALMLALQQLDRILLRVTTKAPTRDEHVHALLLNVSLDTAIPGLSRSEPALGVELCECPRGYSAPSCHQPAVGFWIPPQKVHLNNVAGTIVINLEGDAQECKCNGRATACHPLTGDCVNCTGGTGGPRCEVCAGGYHGSPNAPGGCQACPCPDRTRNFAKACAVNNGRVQCLCKPGYTGLECELCARDHYRADNTCRPCGCDAWGARGAACDGEGRCHCKEHAAGDKCDRCKASRTYLTDGGCKACDNCTQTLLDSIEGVTNDLHNRIDLRELNRIPAPFPALLEFAHNATFTRQTLNEVRNNLKHSRNSNIVPYLNELNATTQELFKMAEKIKMEAKNRAKEALRLSLESMSGLEEVFKQKRLIADHVVTLDEFAKGERHLTAHKALKEARYLLRQIKDVKLIDYIVGASDVADSANLQSTSIQEYAYQVESTNQRLRQLQASLDQWEARADELPLLADIVWNAGDAVAALTVRVRPKLAVIRDTALRCRLILEDISNLNPSNLTDDVHSFILRSHALSLSFPPHIAELEALALAAEEKEGILYNLTPQYRDRYLNVVERYVKQLGEKAREYKSLFSGTRNRASLGITAAHAWSEVAATVRSAADTANAATHAAVAAKQLARGSEPMTHTAQLTMVKSEELKRRGTEALERAEGLRNQLEHLRRGADAVSVLLRGLGWQERELGARPKADVVDTLTAANEQADRVFATTRVLYDEASEVRRRVRYNLRRQLAELQRHGDTALGAAQEHVSQIRGNTARGAEVAAALADAATARGREHLTATTTLSPAIAALRDKIARARHAAESISVSVSSVRDAVAGCARAYSVLSHSHAVTRLSLAVSFDGTVRDGPLVYLTDDTRKQQESESYIKLSILNQHLHLSWCVGGSMGTLLHPQELTAAHDDGDHTSYRIQIERIWNTFHLTVERAGGSAVTASNSTVSRSVTLRGTRLWLGYAPDHDNIAPYGITSGSDYGTAASEYSITPVSTASPPGLPGCVHSLRWDDSAIGLWNFNQQPKDAKCTGCTQRSYNWAKTSDPLAWFNGGGYAELRRSALRPSDRRQFSIALTVRTRDENALLFMAVDNANNRSVQLVMRDCRIVFLVSYGESRLEISARGDHCRGRPLHIQAIRVFAGNRLERGSLRVNGEETLGSPSPPIQSATSLPDLSSATYWIGGVPPGHEAPAPALLGCLGALTVDREGYDLLDTPTRNGVERQCGSRTLRSATLSGSGYMELPSPLLRRKAAIGLSFRTLTDGLLLLRTPSQAGNDVDDEHDGDDSHYLAAVIDNGDLVVVAAAGKDELRVRTNGTRLTDGVTHSLRIVRAHKQLEVWVDDERLASGTLAGNALPARSGGLFIGGITDWDPMRKPVITAAGFKGTIADFIVDSTLVGLETAVNWSGVGLGRADTEPRGERRVEPRELSAPPQGDVGCTKTSSYTVEAGAVKFGDAPGSHAILRLPAKSKELAVSLQYRTFAPDGLLLIVPGTKTKPKHYLALMIREGHLKLVVRGRRRKEVSLPAFVADGSWRSVSIRVSRSRLVLSSGGAAATAHSPPAARSARLYVGGVSDHTTLPPNIVRVGGFLGCIRRVTVNTRSEDLVRDARTHHRVGQCFPLVEQGAYFGGDAYALVSSQWSVVTDWWEARLTFRTAAPNGVLLATRHIVLELNEGSVVLKRLSPSSEEISRTESLGSDGAPLCDNTWHVVTVHVSRVTLSLTLDGGQELKASALLDMSRDPAPLYIGGTAEGGPEPTEGRENFKGCIKDVSIGGHKQNFRTMEGLHNVLLDSCPVAA